jgi:hypothetical protein
MIWLIKYKLKISLRDRSYYRLAVAVHILSFNQGTTQYNHRSNSMRPLRFCRTKKTYKAAKHF